MTITTTFNLILADTISGVIKNLPWFILFYMGFKAIAKELREGIKQMPKWINDVFREMHKQRILDEALNKKYLNSSNI